MLKWTAFTTFFFWAYISLIWYYKLHHKFNVSARWVKCARNLLTFLNNIEFYLQEEILFFSYVLLQHIIMKSSKKLWSQSLITFILAEIFQILYCTVYWSWYWKKNLLILPEKVLKKKKIMTKIWENIWVTFII